MPLFEKTKIQNNGVDQGTATTLNFVGGATVTDDVATIPGGGGGSIPQYSTDPVSPAAEDVWVRATNASITGTPLGLLLSLTHSTMSYTYHLSYKTLEGPIVRTQLS